MEHYNTTVCNLCVVRLADGLHHDLALGSPLLYTNEQRGGYWIFIMTVFVGDALHVPR